MNISPFNRAGVFGKGCVCTHYSVCSDLLWYATTFTKSYVQDVGNLWSHSCPFSCHIWGPKMNSSSAETSAETHVSIKKKCLVMEYVGEVQVQFSKIQATRIPQTQFFILVIKGSSFLKCFPGKRFYMWHWQYRETGRGNKLIFFSCFYCQ